MPTSTAARATRATSNPDGGYFAIDNVAIMPKQTALRDDVNSDGSVDISDVTDLISAVLNGSPVDHAVADMKVTTTLT